MVDNAEGTAGPVALWLTDGRHVLCCCCFWCVVDKCTVSNDNRRCCCFAMMDYYSYSLYYLEI